MPRERRDYRSEKRRRGAEETRTRMLDAARALFEANGFAATTIEQIAAAAGVSAPTVYAAFKSKRGLVAGLVERARFGESYATLVEAANATDDPAARLRYAAAIACQIYRSEGAEIALLRSAGALSPEFAQLEHDGDCARFAAQTDLARHLAASGRLKPGIDAAQAHDHVWVLTSRDIYRMLVVTKNWAPARYEAWLAALLIDSLLVDDG